LPGNRHGRRRLDGDSRRPASGCGGRGDDGGDAESYQVAAAAAADSVAIVVNTTVAAADAATTAATDARVADGDGLVSNVAPAVRRRREVRCGTFEPTIETPAIYGVFATSGADCCTLLLFGAVVHGGGRDRV